MDKKIRDRGPIKHNDFGSQSYDVYYFGTILKIRDLVASFRNNQQKPDEYVNTPVPINDAIRWLAEK